MQFTIFKFLKFQGKSDAVSSCVEIDPVRCDETDECADEDRDEVITLAASLCIS